MRRRNWLLSIALLTTLGLAPHSRSEEPKTDLDQLQGTWSGKLPDGAPVSFEFDGKKVSSVIGDMDVDSEVTLDSKADPKKIEFKIVGGADDAIGQTAEGIYKLEADGKKLVLCVAHPGQARPEKFQAVEGAVFLFELDHDKK